MPRSHQDSRHDDLRKTVGYRLKQVRTQYGITQAELAELAGISEKQISQIEQGISFPGLGLLGDLSSALNLSLASFFDDLQISPSHNWTKHEAAFNELPEEAQQIVERLIWDLLRFSQRK